jgi:hypothetical protein
LCHLHCSHKWKNWAMKYNGLLLKLVIKVSITISMYFQRYLSYHSLSYLFQSLLRLEK